MTKYNKMVSLDIVLEIIDKLEIKDAADGFDSGYNNGVCAAYDAIVERFVTKEEIEAQAGE